MDENALIALVRKAAAMAHFTGYFEYEDDEHLQSRIRSHPLLQQVGTPAEIRRIVLRCITGGGLVECRPEIRPQYQWKREFWFRVNVLIPGFPDPLFYELELTEIDENDPNVAILNVHF